MGLIKRKRDALLERIIGQEAMVMGVLLSFDGESLYRVAHHVPGWNEQKYKLINR